VIRKGRIAEVTSNDSLAAGNPTSTVSHVGIGERREEVMIMLRRFISLLLPVILSWWWVGPAYAQDKTVDARLSLPERYYLLQWSIEDSDKGETNSAVANAAHPTQMGIQLRPLTISLTDSGRTAIYQGSEVNAFADLGLKSGTATVSLAYHAAQAQKDSGDFKGNLSRLPDLPEAANTDGWSLRSGYRIDALSLKPWAAYETWEQGNGGKNRGFDAWHFGLTYFLNNIDGTLEAGYETVMPLSADAAHSKEDLTHTFLLNLSINF
jgi:hypothetical protein